jgi:hypothetical protein
MCSEKGDGGTGKCEERRTSKGGINLHEEEIKRHLVERNFWRHLNSQRR